MACNIKNFTVILYGSLWISCLIGTRFLYAEDENNLFRVKIPYIEQKRSYPKIKDNAKNILIQKVSERKPLSYIPKKQKLIKSITPNKSLAAALFVKDKIFSWRPKWYYKGLGGPKLPCAEINDDSTVLAISETVGEEDGPYASRIILFNCCTLEILKIIELRHRLVERILFIPHSQTLLCFCKKQPRMDQLCGISILDLQSGKELAFVPTPKPESIAVSPDGKKIFFKPIKTPYFYILLLKECKKMHPIKPENKHARFLKINRILSNLDKCAINDKEFFELSRMFSKKLSRMFSKKIKLKNSKVVFAVNKDENLLVSGGQKWLEVFNFNGVPKSKYRLNLNSPIKNLVFIKLDSYLIITQDHNAIVLKNGTVIPVTSDATGIAKYIKNKNWLCINLYKKSELRIFDFLNLQKLFSVYPKKGRIKTRGDLQFFSFIPYGSEKFLILDKAGNLYLMYRKGKRRWRKYLIVTAKR